VIEAAGGVVWRQAPDGGLEVLVVRRERYGDWSWPKGKAEPADVDDTHTALREVLEETGYRCGLGPELTSVRYVDQLGRPKQVRFWAMHVIDGGPIPPNDEVAEVRWVPLPAVREVLTYASDRDVLAAFEAICLPDAPT
jgi:8-oxo-dGTP pyrophosphatase MutT (NUDIX family)